MSMRIAINGFGRIGRAFFKVAFEESDFEIVAVNDLGSLENLAYLLEYDSIYGNYEKEVGVKPSTGSGQENGNLTVDKKEIKFLSEPDPAKLPWKDLDVDVVVESTGVFMSYDKAKLHLDAGAKRVVLSAPA